MKKFLNWVVNNPWKVLFVLFLVTLFFSYQLKNLGMNPDITEALPRSIPAKRLYDKMKEIFPSKDMVMVIYKGDVFSVGGAKEIAELTSLLEEYPEAYSVMSPTNVKIIEGTEEGINVEEALAWEPSTQEDIKKWKDRLAENPAFLKNLISDDEQAAAVIVFLSKSADEDKFAEKLLPELEKFSSSHKGKVFATGQPIVDYYISKGIAKDMGMFFTSGIILIFLLLLFIFSSVRGVLVPLTVVLASVDWTLGFMALIGRPITHATEMLPILIMAIGIADSIHILTHYYQNAPLYESPKELVRNVIHDLYAPVIMTSLTTMAGFIALNTSHMESLEELGMFSAFGVFAALVWSLTFVPAVLSLLKIKAGKGWRDEKGRLRGLMYRYSSFLVRKKRAMAITVAIILLLSVVAISRLRVESSPISQFPEKNPVRVAAEFVNKHFAGTTTFYVLFEGEQDGAMKDPKVLKVMDELERYAENLPYVGSTQSIADFVKLINKAVHNNDPAYFRIPDVLETETIVSSEGGRKIKKKFQVEGKKLVAQLLQLYELSSSPEDFANMVDFNYRNARVAIFVKTDRDSRLRKIDKALSSFLKKKTDGVKADITGMAKLILVVREMVVKGQFWSIIASLFLVWLLTSIMFRSPIIGIFNAVPLFFGIFLNFATMGLLGIPLDIQTMVTSSLAIGIGVDYAIHFIHRYILELRSRDYGESISPSMVTSGVAIVFNSLVVASGFMLLVFSMFKGVKAMGFLLALTMITTAFAALTLLPIYFITFKPKSLKKAAQRREK